MKAKIKILANYEEIAQAEKLGLNKVPEPKYINGVLHFRTKNVYHFYTELFKGEKHIVMFLYPGNNMRIKYNRELYYTLAAEIDTE